MRRYLLDRDVLVELEDPVGDEVVRRWVGAVDDTALYLCSITVFEAQKGFSRARRKARTAKERSEIAAFEAAFRATLRAFAGRVLPVGETEAVEWGELVGAQEKNVMDRAVAAVAKTNGLVVATRNIRHFRGLGVPVIDPFRVAPSIEEPC